MGKSHKSIIPWNKGIPHSEETRRKMSESQKKRFKKYGHNLLGFKHSEETKKNMSRTRCGENSYFYNRSDIANKSNYKRWKINRATGIKYKYYKCMCGSKNDCGIYYRLDEVNQVLQGYDNDKTGAHLWCEEDIKELDYDVKEISEKQIFMELL